MSSRTALYHKIFLTILVSACANEAVLNSDNQETLGTAAKPSEDLTFVHSSPPAGLVFRGRYSFQLREKTTKDSESGNALVVCQALFIGNLYSDSSFVPEGQMTCIDGSKRALIESLRPTPSTRRKDLPGFGRIVRTLVQDNSPVNYLPPLPVGLNVVQNHSEFLNYSFEEPGKVEVIADGETLIDEGVHRLEVTKINQVFKVSKGQIFNKVFEYKTSNTGFNEIPRSLSKIYKSREYLVNSWPPALVQVKITSKLSDFSPGIVGSIGDMLLGDVEVVIKLIEGLPL